MCLLHYIVHLLLQVSCRPLYNILPLAMVKARLRGGVAPPPRIIGYTEFRFQFREYETVVFKNISLVPGKITNVEIERVSSGQDDTKE